jgi:hypothetical protein
MEFVFTMKKLLAAIIAAAFVASFVTSVYAEEQTIKGEAVCTKCELHETDKCATAIRTKVDGKDVIYYAVDNDVAKKFHKSICQGPAKVTAVGTVKEKDGKKMIKLSKIDLD